MRRIAQIFLLLVVLLLGLLIGAVSTETGTRWTLAWASDLVPGLTISPSRGSILKQLAVDHIVYQQDSVHVEVKQLYWQGLTLCKGLACIKGLKAEQVKVTTAANDDANTEVEPSTSPKDPAPIVIDWPLFGVALSEFAIDNIKVDWQSGQLAIKQLAGSLVAEQKGLQVSSLHSALVGVYLNPRSTSTPEVPATPVVLPTLTFAVPTKINDLQVAKLVVPQTPEITDISLSAQANRHRVTLAALSAQMAFQQRSQQLSASGMIDLKQDYPLQIKADAVGGIDDYPLQATLSATGDLKHLTWELRASKPYPLTVSGKTAALGQPFTTSLDVTSRQSFTVNTLNPAVTVSKLNSHVEITGSALSGTVKGCFAVPQPTFSGCVDSKLGLTGDVATVKQLDVRSNLGHWQLSGAWQLPAETGQFAITGQQVDLTPLGINVDQGEVNSDISLSVANGMTASLHSLQAKARSYGYQLTATIDQLNVDNQQHIKLANANVSIGDNHLRLASDPDHPEQIRGWLTGRNLTQIYPELSGDLNGAIVADLNKESVWLKLASNQAGYQEYRLNNAVIEGTTPFDAHNWQIAIRSERLAIPEIGAEQLHIKANGSLHDQYFSVRWGAAKKSAQHPISVNVAGAHHQLSADKHQLVINEADGHWQHVNVKLKQTANLTISRHTFMTSDHCWQVNEGRLCLSQANERQAKAVLTDLPLSIINPWLNTGHISGNFSATAQLNWPKNAQPEVAVNVDLDTGAFNLPQFYKPLRWQPAHLQLKLANKNLTGTLHFPLAAGGALKVVVDQLNQDAVDATITAQQLDADNLRGILGTNEIDQGELSGQVHLSGKPLHPQVSGKLALSRIVLNSEQLPVAADDIHGNVQFTGQQANLQFELNQQDKRWLLSADADWSEGIKLDANVQGDAIKATSRQYGDIWIKPDLHWQQQQMSGTLSGQVTVPKARLKVPESEEDKITVSTDQVVVTEQQTEVAGVPFHLQLDVKGTLGDDVQLSGYGFNGRLTGGVRYQQAPEKDPHLTGEINIADGRFNAYGQDLIVRKGSVVFSGEPATPLINVEAIRNPDKINDSDITVGVRVSGTPNFLQMKLFSEPAMSDPRIFSYLMSGHDIDQDSSQSYSEQAAASLGVGLISSLKYIGQVGNAIGINDLQVNTSGVGDDTQMVISGYVSDDLRVSYGRGIFAEVSQIKLRYQLASDLYLELVSGLHEAVDLFYSFEL